MILLRSLMALLLVAACATPLRPGIIAITNEAAEPVRVDVVAEHGGRQRVTTLAAGESLTFDLGDQGFCGVHDLYIVTSSDGTEVARLESPSCADEGLTITPEMIGENPSPSN